MNNIGETEDFNEMDFSTIIYTKINKYDCSESPGLVRSFKPY